MFTDFFFTKCYIDSQLPLFRNTHVLSLSASHPLNGSDTSNMTRRWACWWKETIPLHIFVKCLYCIDPKFDAEFINKTTVYTSVGRLAGRIYSRLAWVPRKPRTYVVWLRPIFPLALGGHTPRITPESAEFDLLLRTWGAPFWSPRACPEVLFCAWFPH